MCDISKHIQFCFLCNCFVTRSICRLDCVLIVSFESHFIYIYFPILVGNILQYPFRAVNVFSLYLHQFLLHAGQAICWFH